MKKDYRKRLEKEGLASRTVSFYYESMHAVETILTAGGKNTDPRTIGADDVLYLLDYFMAKDFAMQTRKGYVSSLRKYCELNDMAVSEEDPAGSSPAMADCDVRDVDVSERDTHQHPHTPTHQEI